MSKVTDMNVKSNRHGLTYQRSNHFAGSAPIDRESDKEYMPGEWMRVWTMTGSSAATLKSHQEKPCRTHQVAEKSMTTSFPSLPARTKIDSTSSSVSASITCPPRSEAMVDRQDDEAGTRRATPKILSWPKTGAATGLDGEGKACTRAAVASKATRKHKGMEDMVGRLDGSERSGCVCGGAVRGSTCHFVSQQ